jgi:pSer/pThr/pTyr-binding forkhead associated (FHA) protein
MSVWLVMQASDGNERTFAVAKPRMVIGRETTCDVRVPVPSVSDKHCQITFDGSELKLVDLHSDRGTYHNGTRVQEAVLCHEDRLTIGPVTFVVRMKHDGGAGNGQPPEIIIERHDGIEPRLNGQSGAALDAIDDLDAG